MTLERFVAVANIRRYQERLWNERDSVMRRRLHSLLIEEEDRMAADLELVAEAERSIAHLDDLIRTQSALVVVLEKDGGDGHASARGLLDGLVETRNLHQDYHRRLVKAVDQSRVGR